MTSFGSRKIEETEVERFFDFVCVGFGEGDNGNVRLADFDRVASVAEGIGLTQKIQQGLLIRCFVHEGSRSAKLGQKPIGCQICDTLQRSWFLEQMRCSGNDLQFHFTAHSLARLLVQTDYHVILSADNHQRWYAPPGQRIARQIRSPAARYDRGHLTWEFRRSY